MTISGLSIKFNAYYANMKQTLLDLDLYYLSQLMRYSIIVSQTTYIQPRCLVKMFSQALYLGFISVNSAGNETAKRLATSYMIGNLIVRKVVYK
jgi:hypothetical protein